MEIISEKVIGIKPGFLFILLISNIIPIVATRKKNNNDPKNPARVSDIGDFLKKFKKENINITKKRSQIAYTTIDIFEFTLWFILIKFKWHFRKSS